MDLQTDLDRLRRKHLSEHPEGDEPWGFPVPRPMALVFDALPSPFTLAEAEAAGREHDLDAAAVADALREMRARELVSDAPEEEGPTFVKHPEAKNWF